VTRTILQRFLSKKSTQERILQVVLARTEGKVGEAEVDDIVQDANERALHTTALPGDADALRPWVSAIAASAAADHFRKEKRDKQRMEEIKSALGLPDDDALEPTAPPIAFARAADEGIAVEKLSDWLARKVTSRADRLTLEMIRHKAKTDVGNAELAAEFGMTEAAYNMRLQRFKAKWVPAWRKEVRRRRLGIGLGVLVLLLLLAAAWAWLVRPRVGHTDFAAPPVERSPTVVPAPSERVHGPEVPVGAPVDGKGDKKEK
jgi:DNA-directed RNA polymerase specialized sigma24 family protein